jgi:hypothetical protein
MKNIIVIYHSADFDGKFSREIAKRHFGETADYLGWDYGDPLPIIPEGVRIYMIDISVDGLMHRPELVWIDHHKSAMAKYSWPIKGYRIDGVAACRLAWQWFNHPESPANGGVSHALPGKEDFVDGLVTEPLAVRLAGEYDVFDHRDSNAELFQHALRTRELTDGIWDMLLDRPNFSGITVRRLLDDGAILQFAKRKENESIIRDKGFTIEFEGLKFLAVNTARYNSHLFTAGLQPEHDGCFGFHWDGRSGASRCMACPGNRRSISR